MATVTGSQPARRSLPLGSAACCLIAVLVVGSVPTASVAQGGTALHPVGDGDNEPFGFLESAAIEGEHAAAPDQQPSRQPEDPPLAQQPRKGLTNRWLRTDLPYDFAKGQIYVRIQPGRRIEDVMRKYSIPGPARYYFEPPFNAAALAAGFDASFIVGVPAGEEKRFVERLSRHFGNATGADFIWVAVGWRARGWATLVPNDPRYSSDPSGAGRPQSQYFNAINMSPAWDRDIASNAIKVAVIDSGLRGTHEDMGRTTKQFNGWDYVNSETIYPGSNTEWYNGYSCFGDAGHGTHVASIAVAETHNGVGIAGAGWNAALIPFRRLVWDPVAGQCGFYYGVAERGWEIRSAVDHGADVINLSYTFGENPWGFEDQAVQYAYYSGRLVVSTAGNEGSYVKYFPCAYAYVLCVAAAFDNGDWCCNSNYGPWVDYAIPGYLIRGAGAGTDGYYPAGSATSYAAPILSGVIAILAAHPARNRNPDAIAGDLWATHLPPGSGPSSDWVAFGRIDAGAAAWAR